MGPNYGLGGQMGPVVRPLLRLNSFSDGGFGSEAQTDYLGYLEMFRQTI